MLVSPLGNIWLHWVLSDALPLCLTQNGQNATQ
jgi:hypothetical protein